MPTVALSIAGSDSGAGAGIQADLKTFSALGVYGCTAITAITAQNTREVTSIFGLPDDIIRKQIRSIMSDIPPDAIKIGMVHRKEIIQSIYDSLMHTKIPIVLDPIFAAGSGSKLLLDNAFESFVSELVPIATLITPNLMEAEKLAGVKIKSEGDAIEAARKIKKLGVENVIIKGGHSNTNNVIDILLHRNKRVYKLANTRIAVKESHGSGCNFSASITALLARGFQIVDACKIANQYVHKSIGNALKLGKGLVVTNPISDLYVDACRYHVLKELQQATIEIEAMNGIAELLPETQSNIAYALPDAVDTSQIAGVKGRIVRIGKIARPVSNIEFGASRHVASAVLAYMTINRSMRCAMNIRYDKKLLKIAKRLFEISEYQRITEPMSLKKKEGETILWGIKTALLSNPAAEIIYHKGEVGKEPMIMIFGTEPNDVLNKIKKILNNY
ncbi:MAG TPA: bifunctional hydroxymethylpyrimidine kinase/phosphomethylpyrimidine kinase [Nitrososphaeraceae archaeon]|jgi:hydroxymethylpyrimidine kinase / phosphomethylpyrimidine kinase / thiamine-phosphate diphosphorylase|nr:bifunctional hydroxymethylpyrimidine kinase/phosphomethylpyrimidine kinase [Nitrososphaeraceae archaeon]